MPFFDRLFSKSCSTVLHITSGNGFHLRPAAVFAAEAKKFAAVIEARTHGRSINAKSLNALLSLNLEKGDHFELTCKGKDSQEALEALSRKFGILMSNDHEAVRIDKETGAYEGESIEGEIISGGMALSPLWHYTEETIRTQSTTSFTEAVAKSISELEQIYKAHKTDADSGIYLAQKELLASLQQNVTSLEMLEEAVEKAGRELKGGILEARYDDYKDILQRVKMHLGYTTVTAYPQRPFILLADDLLPSQIETLPQNTAGVILRNTSLTSHTAILLRASGIPSLIINTFSIKGKESDEIILDGHRGIVVTNPTPADMHQAKIRIENDKKNKQTVQSRRFKSAVTTSGDTIKVLANVTDVTSAQLAKKEGAEGIGLLRTEFLFKEEKPTFEAQVAAYRSIFSLFEEVTVRTLDIGGDKALPYVTLPPESNPFLGIRGVRLLKTHPKLLEEQIYAIFTAAKGKSVKIMFPMISTVKEFEEAKAFALDVAKKYHLSLGHIEFGIMIEVPSVLFLITHFNDVVDFYSIGTNDLNQYLFATERTHATLKLDPRSEVLFDAIKKIVDEAEKPVSICGELAGDTKAIGKLIKIGARSLSVSAKNIAQTKETIRNV